MEILAGHELPADHQEIKSLRKNEWTTRVKSAIEKKNKIRLLEDCHKEVDGQKTRKTKTSFIVDHIENQDYQRTPLNEILQSTKTETKTLLTARFGMLECGRNFKGTKDKQCVKCGVLDDETHRLNHCTLYEQINFCSSVEKVDFRDTYSTDICMLRAVIPKIQQVWNIKSANGSMNVD